MGDGRWPNGLRTNADVTRPKNKRRDLGYRYSANPLLGRLYRPAYDIRGTDAVITHV